MRAIATIEARPLPLSQLGERYRRYRLTDPAAETAMARSLCSYGQLAPVTACWRDGRAELLDGFKRHTAAAQVAWPTLSVRLVDVDERSAKAAIFGLNHTGQHPSELEEAWIVQALVREDGLSQVEAAQLLNRHKSWVCLTEITDAGLAHLAGLTALESLNVGHTKITDAGMKTIAGFTKLESLDISYLKITDAGFETLAGLTKLKSLHLEFTSISDDAVPGFSVFKKLESLFLVGSRISPKGAVALKKVLPKAKVDR